MKKIKSQMFYMALEVFKKQKNKNNQIKKTRKCWLFTDWELGLASFRIYDDFDSMNYITGRRIGNGKYVNWFNIDNLKREIEDYAIKNNIKLYGLDETIRDIQSKGFSYTDKNKLQNQISANEKMKKFDVKITLIN